MNISFKSSIAFIFIFTLISSCVKKYQEIPPVTEVWVPVYGDSAAAKTVKSSPLRNTDHAGKIYIYNNYLFQIDNNRGIHVFEFSEKKPQRISFIEVTGAQEISIRNNVLYTNNINDVIGIDISDIFDIKVISRIPDVFQLISQEHPPVSSGYFECIDKSKGYVTGWDLKTDVAATCKYN